MALQTQRARLAPLSSVACTALVLSLSGLLFSACGQDIPPAPIRNFDRPSEMVFTCYGDLRIDGEIIVSAQSIASCQAHLAGEPPEGQEGLVPPNYFGFVLQPARGTLAVVNVDALGVQDNDPLTPGLNAVPVGTLPVGLATDRSGCFVVTANAGSCDLAVINTSSVLDRSVINEVNRFSITTPGGVPFLVRPRQLTEGPPEGQVGEVCPQTAQGFVYAAYPDCNMVAAIDAGTGQIDSALIIDDDGSTRLASEDDFAACPAQCGDGALDTALGVEPDGGTGESFEARPVALEMEPGGERLFLGGDSSPYLTVVPLGADGRFSTAIERVRVEGEVGLLRLALTGPIEMGGSERQGMGQAPGPTLEFAYAIATDDTVRVINLTDGVECDTQVDPRYLRGERDPAVLSCFPVGGLATPPRRYGAKSPGIHLPGDYQVGRNGQERLSIPLDLSIVNLPSLDAPAEISDPNIMVGSFAFVSTSTGFVFIVNVDDDNYSDYEIDGDPLSAAIPLALPHQLRDDVVNRDALSFGCLEASNSNLEQGPRLAGLPRRVNDIDEVASSNTHLLPSFQGITCSGTSDLGNPIEKIVTELSFEAPGAIREAAYPDWRVVENQAWSLAWEGSLSADTGANDIDGPPVRKGLVEAGDPLRLIDPNEAFCAAGVEPYDIAGLLGCNPLVNDAQCGIGERCYVHPDSRLASGVCIKEDQIDFLTGPCREFFISRRRYTVVETQAGTLALKERRRVLSTTPLDGCESDSQCQDLYELERRIGFDEQPININLGESPFDNSFVCEADPSRKPGPDRCVMSCEAPDDCEVGFTCSAGRCVEGPLPFAECVEAVQRFQLFAGEAFAVVGEDDGYLHPITRNEENHCVVDPGASPLAIGRIPLRPEPCDGDGDPLTGPNPCREIVEHTETIFPYDLEGGVCVPLDTVTRTRETPGVFFANPSMQFHLANTETQGDANCINDLEGDFPSFGTTYGGYQLLIEVNGGFLPKSVPGLEAALPTRVVEGPEGDLWVLDQGDASGLTRGRLYRLDPGAAAGFDLTTLL